MKSVLDGLVYLVVRGFLACLARLPRSLAYRLCESIALLVHAVDRKHRRIGMINLRIAFPDKDDKWRGSVLRASFMQLGRHAVELSRLTRLRPEQVKEQVTYEEGRGIENYRLAKEGGRGVLFVTAHVSAWELLPAAHAMHGHPLGFIVRPLDNPYLDAWSLRVRARHGNSVIAKNQAVRRALQMLRAGQDVGFLIDQNIQEKEGVFVPFFGKPACTTASVAALALKTGSPVVPGFIYPTRTPGRYRIRFYPPVIPNGASDEADQLLQLTAAFNRHIEEVIREFPDCWLWGHRRFGTQPDGSNPYL